MTIFDGAYDGDCGISPIALHIASITPERASAKPTFRRRAWRFLLNLAGMAMCLSLLPAVVVLAMRFTLAAAR